MTGFTGNGTFCENSEYLISSDQNKIGGGEMVGFGPQFLTNVSIKWLQQPRTQQDGLIGTINYL